jgi:hypothetical protein
MKTRYEILQSAGDQVDSVLKALRLIGERDLAKQAAELLDALYEVRDASWNERNAEPELEDVA